MNLVIKLWTLILITLTCTSAQSDVLFIPSKSSDISESQCVLQGQITKADVRSFWDLTKKGCKTAVLSSSGGNVEASLQIGRIVRRSSMYVVVPQWGQCFSACVFVYAGGVVRANYGPLGIHRPYNISGIDLSEDQLSFQSLKRMIREYLDEVNVSSELLDLMIATPSEDNKILTLTETERLRLGQTDPVYEHYLDKGEAQKLGIPIAHYLSLKKIAKGKCGDRSKAVALDELKPMADCWGEVFRSK